MRESLPPAIQTDGPDAREADGSAPKTLGPDLYRQNAFRMVELPTTASTRDLNKRRQIVEAAAGAGLPVPPGNGRALPLDPAPDADAVRDAVQRLSDPGRRLVDELFWFWPASRSNGPGSALAALANGDTKRASELWQAQASSDDPAAAHDLAILAHAQALDCELTGRQSDLSVTGRERRDLAWQQAFERWRLFVEDDAGWLYLRERVSALDDPRLTEHTVDSLRRSLPSLLLSINASLAVSAAEQDLPQDADRHLSILRRSGFDEATRAEVLRQSIHPLHSRIESLCRACDADAKADPDHADAPAYRLIQQARPLLAAIDRFLPKGDPSRVGVHDAVAQKVLDCDIPFGNRTKRWRDSAKLLTEALPIAEGAALVATLQKNIQVDETNAQEREENETCWFCKKAAPDDSAAAEVKMHGDVTRQPVYADGGHLLGYQTQWRGSTVKVPRCKGCERVHLKTARPKDHLGFGWVLLGMASYFALAFVEPSLLIAASPFSVLLALVYLVGVIRDGLDQMNRSGDNSGRTTRPESAKLDFPGVSRLRTEGWAVGEKPPGVGEPERKPVAKRGLNWYLRAATTIFTVSVALGFAVTSGGFGGAEPAPTATTATGPATATAVPAAVAPTRTPSPSPTAPRPSATPTKAQPKRLIVANTGGDGVYLRRTPSKADRLVAWPDGTPLTPTGVTAQGDGWTWLEVRDPKGNVGLVPAQYVAPGD